MTYSNRLRLTKSKPGAISRSRNRRRRVSPRKKRLIKWYTTRSKTRRRISKLIQAGVVAAAGIGVLATVVFMQYLQGISQDLPTPEQPFGSKSTTSEIYDRNGKLLYRVFDDEDRDPVKLKDIPPLVKWAFLAAEDANYFEHSGVDLKAMLRCGVRLLVDTDNICGGSTITQQLIRKTALTDEVNLERKLKEIILALKIEQDRDKDEILEMYFRIIPEGSNIYGVTRASKFYFGKKLKKLNLAEIAVLAAIPQNPSLLSPTKSLAPELAHELLNARKNYVLDQMERHMGLINSTIADESGNESPVLTEEMIADARDFKLSYKKPIFNIKAPHFVFYVQERLQKWNYNGDKPFTLEEIETGGLRIYTTLDLKHQKIAEQQVRKGVNEYGAKYGASNASLVSLNPQNGEVLSYVGSFNYFGKKRPVKCKLGRNCRFEPQVSIPTTLQAYGSSMKPMIYYKAIEQGLIAPDTIMSDVPITIDSYKPKNYEGKFFGNQTARWMLINSRNIPAIMLTDMIGTENLLTELRRWGYRTLNNPAGYGPSIAVGGGDIKLIEHAQAYGVLANEGKLVKHEVILRIEDSDGNVIWEHEPREQQVADPNSVYLVNNMLNGRYGGLGDSWDGRDVSGKTGTSDQQKETLFITYTPEIVVAGWLGNNNNNGMVYGATGYTSARPWVSEYLQRLGDKIPPTAFRRPEGVYWDYDGSLNISGLYAPKYLGVPSKYKPSFVVGETNP